MNEQDARHRKNIPGIKREYLKVPEIMDNVEDWICVQLQIPDDDEYIRQFYDIFDTFLGMWFNYRRDNVMGGARTAKMWRLARQTIELDSCGGDVIVEGCNPTPIGSIVMWPAASAIPENWLICEGQWVGVSEYPELFALIGYTYGGFELDFALPNFTGRSPIGLGQVGEGQTYIEGTLYGSEQRTLLVSNLPPHQHNILAKDNTGLATNARLAAGGGAGTDSTKITQDGSANGATSTPFDIVHPVTAITFIIRVSDDDCEYPIVQGEKGEPGATGAPGEQGVPGICEDCDVPPVETQPGDVPAPIPGIDNTRCRVAQGTIDSLLDNYYIPLLDFFIEMFVTEGLNALQVVEALRLTLIGQTAGAILWPPSAVALIGTMGSALFGAMVALANAAQAQNNLDTKNELNDEETREELYCILFNLLGADGDITADVWGDFLDQTHDSDNFAIIHFSEYLRDNLPLYVARTEAYITDGGDFDCAECGWCYLWNTTGGTLDDWTITQGSIPGVECGSLEGRTVTIEMEFDPPVHITSWRWYMSGVNSLSPFKVFINGNHVWQGLLQNGESGGGGSSFDEVTTIKMEGINARNFCVNAIKLTGKGTNPFGSSNCI